MKPPEQDPCCECCGAPIPALKWTGTYAPVIAGGCCAYCKEPIEVKRLRWAPEDAFTILKETMDCRRFVEAVGPYTYAVVYGVRVAYA